MKGNGYIENFPVQAKASFWFLICAFLQKGISMITAPIFTRLLSTDEYGKYNVFNSWLGICTIFVSLNLSAGVYIQGLIKYGDERKQFASALQGLTTFLFLVWTVVYLVFRNTLNSIFELTTVQMMAMLMMIWTSAAFNFWAFEQRVLYKYRNLVIITIAVSVAKPVIGIIFVVLAEDKVTARILGLLLVELLCYSGLFVVQNMRGKILYSARFWKYALIFNIPLIPHYLSQTVLNSADRIMISKMVGDGEAGIYSLAYSISSIMVMFNTALMQTLNPWIYQKIKSQRIKEIESIAYISLVLIAFVNLLLIMLAPEAVAIFAPESYFDAIWVIPPVAMSVYFMFGYDLFAKFAFYYEKTKMIMLASVFGAVLNIFLNYYFIRKFGYKAAGYTTLVCYIIYSISHYLFMDKVCDLYCDGIRPYSINKILAITISFLFIGFLLLLTYNHIIIRYGLIGTAVFVAIMKRKIFVMILKKLISLKKT